MAKSCKTVKEHCNFFLIYFVILPILVVSCAKLIDEFYLTSEMKAQIPFQGNENLFFDNTTIESIKFYGGNRIQNISKVTECISCSDYFLIETESISFVNNEYEINLYSESSTTSLFSVRFKINEDVFRCSFYSPLSIEKLKGGQLFYDSIPVNEKVYYDVFSDTLTHTGMVSIDPYPVRVYYSTEFGVIRIKYSDSTNMDLEKIEW